jgi:hypothetical protein
MLGRCAVGEVGGCVVFVGLPLAALAPAHEDERGV